MVARATGISTFRVVHNEKKMASENRPVSDAETSIPRTWLPTWSIADLPKPSPLGLHNWKGFIGPGIVMCGIQIGGGEWLFGPEITVRYGGGLMWIAKIAIILQVFYNLEAGRYTLYTGEPIFTGFMRTRPGPSFWVVFILLLNFGALIPGLSTHGAAIVASLVLDRPPGPEDKAFVTYLSYGALVLGTLPILIGGKIYNMVQVVMTIKVIVVLGFCLVMGVFFVSPENWANVFSGFLKFGNVPVADGQGGEDVVNLFGAYLSDGQWPVIAMGNIAVLRAFAGFAGGGGLSNSVYSNMVRDKGWGMGSHVGAIDSAIGGRKISLSHLGSVFPTTPENMSRWRGWWRYLITDQLFIWAPGCVMGMALPALISIEFSEFSPLYNQTDRLDWAQAVISADGLRHAPQFSQTTARIFWVVTLFVGMMVLLPSQMSIVEAFSRRWTDIIWSANRRVRSSMADDQVHYVYYSILGCYVVWTFFCAYLFNTYGTPKLMVLVVANLNNIALAVTAFHLLWINRTLLPEPLRPRWYSQLGLLACTVLYLGLSGVVFHQKQLPLIREWLSGG